MNNTPIRKMNIKQWSEQDRPREKLLLNGRRSLTEAELMAILIGSGSVEETAVELSKRILFDQRHDLNRLAKMTLSDLCHYKGIGEAKAISIIAALELGRRRKKPSAKDKVIIRGSEDAYRVLKPLYADLGHEEFWVLFLNNANRVLARELISKGGVGMVSVDLKILFQVALQMKATTMILSHNHPSGSLIPSEADKQLTNRIKNGSILLGLGVLDHIIVSEEGYYSFTDHDEM